MEKKSILVISAHAADFVWRSGGMIAKHIQNGDEVTVVVLSYGIRGESNHLWKQEDQTEERVRCVRNRESRRAAEILGIEQIEYWDYEDYPMFFEREHLNRIAEKIRAVRPDILVTHDRFDALNPDHDRVSKAVFEASVMSNSAGVLLDGNHRATKQMEIYGFEPHQTEISQYVPGTILDITSVYDQKVEAMKCFEAQHHLIEYYTQRAVMRGNHARRISGNQSYRFAESFSRYFPRVSELL